MRRAGFVRATNEFSATAGHHQSALSVPSPTQLSADCMSPPRGRRARGGRFIAAQRRQIRAAVDGGGHCSWGSGRTAAGWTMGGKNLLRLGTRSGALKNQICFLYCLLADTERHRRHHTSSPLHTTVSRRFLAPRSSTNASVHTGKCLLV